MATKKVRYTQPLLGEANAAGYLILVPGASVLVRQSGVACSVYSDNAGTAMTNPVPTGVAPGSPGVDTRGTLLVYLDPGNGYDGLATVGNASSTFAISDISPDVSDVPAAGGYVDTTTGQTIGGLKNFTTAPTVNGSAISGAAAPLTLTAPVATNVPLTLKGAVSQSGDLLKFQSSAAVSLARIDSAGRQLIGADSLGVTAGVIDGFLVISNQDSSKKNFISRGSPRGDGFQYTSYIADGAHFITNGSITSNGESSLFPLLARQSQSVQYMIGMRCDLSPGLDNASLVSDTVNGINHFNAFAQGGGLHPWFQIAWDGKLLWGDGAITSGFSTIGRASDGSLILQVNGTDRLRLDASGKIGIGTATPAAPLTIDAAAGDQLRLRSVPNRYRGDFDVGGSGMTFTSFDDTSGVFMPYTVQASQTIWNVGFTEKMRLNTNGDLGVGTNDPQGGLHVKTRSNFWPTIVAQGTTSQASPIQEWRDVALAVLHSITPAGLPKWDAAANQQTTVGAAGGGSALPATPTKYLKVVDSAGTTLVVPAYAAA